MKLKVFIATVLCLFLSACGDNIKTASDYRPNVDFASLKTFAFLKFENTEYQQIWQDRVRDAIARELEAKGMRKVEEDQADVLVAYHIFAESKQKQRVTSTGGGYYYYGRRYYGPSVTVGTTYVENIDYKVGNVVADFIDPISKDVIYNAKASTKIDDARTPEDRNMLINAAVEKMFREYPPRTRGSSVEVENKKM